MRYNTRANVLIYTLILVNLILIMALVVLNTTFTLEQNYRYQENNKNLTDAVMGKAQLALKQVRFLNSNGSGFLDVISCPNSVTMSGTTSTGSAINTSLRILSGSVYCEGSYSSNPFYLYFDADFTDFVSAEYQASSVNLVGGVNKNGDGNFLDGDSTLISFLGTSYQLADGIDDNLDSDNYKYFSTGATTYPDGYVDDDDDGRTQIFGYLSQGGEYQNIFWNNRAMEKYILNNTNNTGSLNITLSGASTYAYFDIDRPYSLKIVQFDKDKFISFNEMSIINQTTNEDIPGGIGYLQSDFTLSGGITGSEYVFDIGNYDYALFMKNAGSGSLLYKMNMENAAGSGVYINPIGDDHVNLLKYYGGHVLQDEEGKYLYKQFEVIEKK